MQYSRAGGKNPAEVSERFFDPAAKAALSGFLPPAECGFAKFDCVFSVFSAAINF